MPRSNFRTTIYIYIYIYTYIYICDHCIDTTVFFAVVFLSLCLLFVLVLLINKYSVSIMSYETNEWEEIMSLKT